MLLKDIAYIQLMVQLNTDIFVSEIEYYICIYTYINISFIIIITKSEVLNPAQGKL